MPVRFHPHAQDRMLERGATEDEVHATVEFGRAVLGSMRPHRLPSQLLV